jgi:hypothetical protein
MDFQIERLADGASARFGEIAADLVGGLDRALVMTRLIWDSDSKTRWGSDPF